VSRYDDLSTGDFLTDHIVIGDVLMMQVMTRDRVMTSDIPQPHQSHTHSIITYTHDNVAMGESVR